MESYENYENYENLDEMQTIIHLNRDELNEIIIDNELMKIELENKKKYLDDIKKILNLSILNDKDNSIKYPNINSTIANNEQERIQRLNIIRNTNKNVDELIVKEIDIELSERVLNGKNNLLYIFLKKYVKNNYLFELINNIIISDISIYDIEKKLDEIIF